MELRAGKIFLFLFASPTFGNILDGAMFSRKELCDVQTRLANKCMTKVSSSESSVRCCARCNLNSSCSGASLEATTSSCYLHSECNTVTNCSKKENNFVYFEKKLNSPVLTTTEGPLICVHGTWNATTESCTCTFNYVGKLCERQPYNCTELYQNYPAVYGLTQGTFQPPQMKLMFMGCFRNKSSMFTQVLHNFGEIGWNRTRTSYDKGFRGITPPFNISFWVGLKYLLLFMGPNPRNIRLNVDFYTGASVKSIAHRYTGVVIGDNSTNYLLTYAGHTSLTNGAEGNCLEFSNMTTFSTWDADHDGDSSENWALRAGGGWWFPAFNFSCNPVGSFYNRNTTPATGDGYVRLSGVSTDDISNYLRDIYMYIEEDYV